MNYVIQSYDIDWIKQLLVGDKFMHLERLIRIIGFVNAENYFLFLELQIL